MCIEADLMMDLREDLDDTCIIRPLESKDLDQVCAIEEKAFSMPWKREDFEGLIKDNDSDYFVVDFNGRVVGTAGYTNQVGEGYINNVVIDEDYRGRGLAEELLRAVICEGNEKGIKDFTLEVRVSNIPAIKLYEKLGFKSVGIRKRFYEHPVEDAHVMWLYGSDEDKEC